MVTVAGIDCGTNSIRLMIAQQDSQGLHIIVPRIMRVVRLGEGVDVHHTFSAEALQRVYKAIDEFASIIREHDVDIVRFVATSATRDARNRNEFEEYIHDKLGVYPDIISGEEEARLSFLGATSSANLDKYTAPFLVVDLGGGSTELVLGGQTCEERTKVVAAYSMNIGSVRMAERHHLEDAPSDLSISEAIQDIDRHIHEASHKVPLERVRTIIGVSGTVTTMSALVLGQTQYDRDAVDGVQILVSDVETIDEKVLRMSRIERDTLTVVHPGRRDVIGAGALVWSRILRYVQNSVRGQGVELSSYIASEHGLLDGIVRDLAMRAVESTHVKEN